MPDNPTPAEEPKNESAPKPAPAPEPTPEAKPEPPPAPKPPEAQADQKPATPESPAPEQAPAAKARLVEPEGIMDKLIVGAEGPADTRNAQNVYAAGDVVAYVAVLGTAPPVGFAQLSSSVWGCLGWLDTAGGIFNLNHTTKDVGAAGTLSAIRTIFTGGAKTLQITCLEALNPLVRALFDDVPLSTLAPTSRVDAGCGTTSGSATVTDASAAVGDVGSSVSGTGIPANATIISVSAGVSFTMSANATATGSASVTVTSANSVYVIPEIPQDNRYCLVLDTIDGANQVRMFAPMAKVTARGNDQIQQGDSENLQMTFTFYPASITYGGNTSRGSLLRYINYGTLTEAFSEAPQISVNP